MLRFAVIGTSDITSRFLDALAGREDAVLYAVYSRSMARAQALGASFGAQVCYDDLEKLAADEQVDAVYIASPNSLHFEQALRMLAAGKHVLCEKPMASTLRQAQQMFAAAQRSGKVLMEAMRSTYTPGLAVLKGLLEQIGPIRRATIQYSKYSSRYDLVKQGRPVNIFSREFSSGALMDLGVYCVHFALELFGAPSRIRAAAVSLPCGVDGAGTILAEYDGKLVELLYSKITDNRLPSQIQGERGSILIAQPDQIEHLSVLWRDGRRRELDIPNPPNGMCGELQHFLLRVAGKADGRRETQRTLAAMQLMDEARRQTGIRFPADVWEPEDPRPV